jgi:hypothetical protein
MASGRVLGCAISQYDIGSFPGMSCRRLCGISARSRPNQEKLVSQRKIPGDKKQMQIDDYYQTGLNPTREGILAQCALKEFEQHLDNDWMSVDDRRIGSRGAARYGLALAVPLSLSLWMALGALLWALTR